MSFEEKESGTTALDIQSEEKQGLAELLHSGSGLVSPFMKDIFLLRQGIVGTRYLGGADQLARELKPGSKISFVREPDNRFDPRAVMALDAQGRKLGYIPRHENAVIGALMQAGKYFYGRIPEDHAVQWNATGTEKVPYMIWVDLYMREFALLDDLCQIPRQGYLGSYAVTDFTLDDEEERISRIYAVKVINGEETDVFFAGIDGDNSEEYRHMLHRFCMFTGYLPIVSHGVTDVILPILKEAYGVQLGKPFSNFVTDTMQMAENHLYWVKDASLTGLADALGIDRVGETPEEIRCRHTWRLYCRMERSELKKTEL